MTYVYGTFSTNTEHLTLRNNFLVTKKFFIAKFDCMCIILSSKFKENPKLSLMTKIIVSRHRPTLITKIGKYVILSKIPMEFNHHLKCGFLKKSFIMNAPLVSCPFLVITFGWVQQQTHPDC